MSRQRLRPVRPATRSGDRTRLATRVDAPRDPVRCSLSARTLQPEGVLAAALQNFEAADRLAYTPHDACTRVPGLAARVLARWKLQARTRESVPSVACRRSLPAPAPAPASAPPAGRRPTRRRSLVSASVPTSERPSSTFSLSSTHEREWVGGSVINYGPAACLPVVVSVGPSARACVAATSTLLVLPLALRPSTAANVDARRTPRAEGRGCKCECECGCECEWSQSLRERRPSIGGWICVDMRT
ncbi:hypothetical protein C8Q80DRAFT_436445 [Daedaleopsis nitida]|nr:hypothetical protein C8Q80DRAFT_436445 [Daedaleopsis nitida]